MLRQRLGHTDSSRLSGVRPSPPTQRNRLIVLANRAPFRHELGPNGGVLVRRSASGLVTALEPLLENYSGTWVAHGSGYADPTVVDGNGGLDVPPASPRYRLRYVWLEQADHRGYYYGFANEALWPLCHKVDVRPVFRPDDFYKYARVNARFAGAVAEEAIGAFPLIFVQDYHFTLAPRILRERLPASVVVAFWHIPWPRPQVFRTCPWGRQLLDGLLGANIVGYQTDEDRMNLLGSIESMLDADVDRQRNIVRYRGQTTHVRIYPVGVDWESQALRSAPPVLACREQVCGCLKLPHDIQLGVGIDRMDYTKGINHKLLAIERLLDVHHELRGRFVFVQIAEPRLTAGVSNGAPTGA
jgi:trehalose 6-phosphate synthase